MSEEQLKDIKNTRGIGFVSLERQVFNSLIEQAERVQELQAENETLSSANQDLLHEVRVLRNKVDQSKEYEDFVFHHNVDVDVEMRKLHEQNKRYRERIEYMLEEAKDHKEKGLTIQHWALIKDLEETLEGEE